LSFFSDKRLSEKKDFLVDTFMKIGFAGGFLIASLFLVCQEALSFHPDVYAPRVPLKQLEEVRNIKPLFEDSLEIASKGQEIYFGKGQCVTCHSNNGKGVTFPGHAPRNFTDERWQSARTDGELMWVLKNGSPGTGMPLRVGRVITEAEGWSVIQFIRTFRRE